MEENNCCIICFENITENKYFQKWECCHRFHESCIKTWNQGCPICRTNKLHIKECVSKNPKNNLDLDRMKKTNLLIDEKYNYIYKKKWSDDNCIREKHKLWLFKTYGVIGICDTCNTVQGFNLLH